MAKQKIFERNIQGMYSMYVGSKIFCGFMKMHTGKSYRCCMTVEINAADRKSVV